MFLSNLIKRFWHASDIPEPGPQHIQHYYENGKYKDYGQYIWPPPEIGDIIFNTGHGPVNWEVLKVEESDRTVIIHIKDLDGEAI